MSAGGERKAKNEKRKTAERIKSTVLPFFAFRFRFRYSLLSRRRGPVPGWNDAGGGVGGVGGGLHLVLQRLVQLVVPVTAVAPRRDRAVLVVHQQDLLLVGPRVFQEVDHGPIRREVDAVLRPPDRVAGRDVESLHLLLTLVPTEDFERHRRAA